MDINTDPSCSRTMDPDMSLRNSTDPYIIMVSSGRAHHINMLCPHSRSMTIDIVSLRL